MSKQARCSHSLFAALCIFLTLTALSCSAANSPANAESGKSLGAEEQTMTGFLPAAGDVGEWTPAGEPVAYRGENLFEHIDGGADVYYEYGFVTLLTQEYKNEDEGVSVEIYCMADPSSAFGIYSYNRHPTLSPIDIGSDGAIHSNGLFFWKGRYYVDVRQIGSAKVASEHFIAFAKSVDSKIGTVAERPDIMNLLPAEDMVPRSEVYALGPLGINNQVFVASEDLFGLGKGEAAAIARYRIGQPEFSVIIAEYASDQACKNAFIRFRDHFLGAESRREKEFVTGSATPRHYGVRMEKNKLIVVANADSQKNALEMLDRISDHLSGGDKPEK